MNGDALEKLCKEKNLEFASKEFSEHLDSIDELKVHRVYSFPFERSVMLLHVCHTNIFYPSLELKEFRDEYLFPEAPEGSGRSEAIYLCGNSLGIQPKGTRTLVNAQMDKWAREGVEGHFTEPTQWLTIDDTVQESCARLVGAERHEVAAMNSLTVNLHLMMCAFYRPTATRHKILIEKKAFPSDIHAVTSQILHHNLDPASSLVEIAPRNGESTLRDEDIEAAIEREGESLALVMFSGVQYVFHHANLHEP